MSDKQIKEREAANMSLEKSDDGPQESDRGFYKQDSLGQQTKKKIMREYAVLGLGRREDLMFRQNRSK